MNVAVLGLGLMGLPMARRLCQAGLNVHVWNRTASKAAPLTALGATAHATAAQAMAQAEIVITILEDGQVVEAVLLDPTHLAALRPGTLVVDMSSIAPAQARAHAQALQARGVRYLDAPVSGGTLGAEQGTLAIMVGGEENDLAYATPVLSHLGRTTLVGPHGCGSGLCRPPAYAALPTPPAYAALPTPPTPCRPPPLFFQSCDTEGPEAPPLKVREILWAYWREEEAAEAMKKGGGAGPAAAGEVGTRPPPAAPASPTTAVTSPPWLPRDNKPIMMPPDGDLWPEWDAEVSAVVARRWPAYGAEREWIVPALVGLEAAGLAGETLATGSLLASVTTHGLGLAWLWWLERRAHLRAGGGGAGGDGALT